MWRKANRWKLIVPVLVVAVLAAAFWYGGGAPGLQGWTAQPNEPAQTPVEPALPVGEQAEDPAPVQTPAEAEPPAPAEPDPAPTGEQTEEPPAEEQPGANLDGRPGGEKGGMTADEKLAAAAALAGTGASELPQGDAAYSQAQGMVLDPATGKDAYLTDPVPEGKPLPVEPENAEISETAYTCTLSISCASILAHMDWLDPEKTELGPEDGWLLPPTEVTFYEGESVFNVLQRTCKQARLHMEFENTPMYNSAYIEGIGNLYEFDCGELSGWMYKVNDWFPNYGCSRYALQNGDVVCWEYTCDLGFDVGGGYAMGGE